MCFEGAVHKRWLETHLTIAPYTYMFDLDKALAAWRRTLEHNRAFTPDDIDELERHIRDEVHAQMVRGIDEETAHAIVDARDRTPLESRGSIAWAVEAGVMSQESLIQAGDWLTARSTQWRVRVEGGFEAPADDAGVVAAPATLLDRVVYEAVIDVSTRRPRLASLREITGLRESLALDAGREDAPESIAEIVGENLLDEAALLDTPEEPEFTRLRQRPPRLTTVDESDTIDAAPPDGAAPEDATASDDAPGAAAGRTGRWTRGGGS